MEGRHVDITVISAADLKKVSLLGKMHTYASVWIDPYFRQCTPVDEHRGANPAWNQHLSFPVPEHFFQQPSARLHVEIYSKAALAGDKLVGAASIPLSEIAQKPNQETESTHQLHGRRSGKPKGSVRLLIKVGERTSVGAATAPPAAAYPDAGYKQYEGAYAYPSAASGVPAEAPLGYPPSAPPAYVQPAYGQPYHQQPPYYQAPQQPSYYQAPQQPAYYQAQQPPKRRLGGGGMGMGLGTGLLAGAVGGLILGDLVDDSFDGGCDGGGFFGF